MKHYLMTRYNIMPCLLDIIQLCNQLGMYDLVHLNLNSKERDLKTPLGKR